MNNSIIPYKNRIVNLEKKVYVYRNLNCKSDNETFSIMQNGLVVGHTHNLHMYDIDFIVRESGKIKALKTKRRNVHAFIKGYIHQGHEGIRVKEAYTPVKYDSFSNYGFIFKNNGQNIVKSKVVAIKKDQILASEGVFDRNPKIFS